MNQFTLKIKLGNDAMQTHDDVREALLEVCDKLEHQQNECSIRDINGNTVGTWEFSE